MILLSLYSWVNVNGLLNGLSDTSLLILMGSRFQWDFHDKSRSAPITIFGDILSIAKNEQELKLTDLPLCKYGAHGVLKNTEITSFVEVKMENYDITIRQISQCETITFNILLLELI